MMHQTKLPSDGKTISEQSADYYIGLMSGTSLDGVDGVLARFDGKHAEQPYLMATAYQAFSAEFRQLALALQTSGEHEIEREAALAQLLTEYYAACVEQLLAQHGAISSAALPVSAEAASSEIQLKTQIQIRAIGAHGQTIRHRPELGWTRQTNHPALLAELTGIDVVADFRSRDVAAGGQGAPLVPAFHRAVFADPHETRVVLNIGGISNISILHASGATTGFDTGPGNVLMDAWTGWHLAKPYDENGAWASTGVVQQDLLDDLSGEAYFQLAPPKSTGRDLFSEAWLKQKISGFPDLKPADVQATLCAFTAATIAEAILRHAPDVRAVYVCGGGAYNACLMQFLSLNLRQSQLKNSSVQADVPLIRLESTEALGVSPNHVEALAFAWLAQRFTLRLPANLPEVTGAKGLRILGALYPA